MTRDTNDRPKASLADESDAKDVPDPRDTEHPAGEDHAKRNQENEPVA
jgi:hypothetical protein